MSITTFRKWRKSVARQKGSKAERDKLIAKATRLLGEGKTQTEVARACKVSTRTVQRWASASPRPHHTDPLITAADRAVRAALTDPSVQQQINDLVQYRDSQKFLALEMGTLAAKLSKISLQAIERLEDAPQDVSPRLLPQFLRAVAELSEKASNCWARSVGLEDLLERIGDEPKVDSQG